MSPVLSPVYALSSRVITDAVCVSLCETTCNLYAVSQHTAETEMEAEVAALLEAAGAANAAAVTASEVRHTHIHTSHMADSYLVSGRVDVPTCMGWSLGRNCGETGCTHACTHKSRMHAHVLWATCLELRPIPCRSTSLRRPRVIHAGWGCAPALCAADNRSLHPRGLLGI